MRILVIANGYPTPNDPQWGCFERDQAMALKACGHDVAILAVDTRFRWYKRKYGISVIRKDGFPVYWGFWIPTRLLGFRGLADKVTFRLYDRVYSKILKEWGKPDLLFAHYQRNIYFSLYLKKKYGLPLVGMEHWSALMLDPLPRFVAQRGRDAYPAVDRLLSVSGALSESIRKKFNVPSEVVNDMLGPEFLDYVPGARKRDGEFRFIAVGSLLPVKGYDLLINAFAASGLASRGCSLSIIGDGPERATLSRMVVEHNLSESVHLLGRKMKGEIVQELRNSDAFVLSSRSETFGVACIEALSQGLPCIVTRCGGPEEIVTAKEGIMIDPGNVEAMADALKQLYGNYDRYDQKEIADRCLGRFSPRAIATRLTGIFEDTVQNYK